MLALSVVIYCLVGLGLIGMGYKYITTPAPMDYHREILANTPLTDETRLILDVLYKVMGGSFAALGAGIGIVALCGIWADLFWAKLAVLVMLAIAGYFATTLPHKVEAQTGVKTPWRIAAALSGLGVIAFLLALI